MDIFSKKAYMAIVLVTCVLAFLVGMYKSLQNNSYVSIAPPQPVDPTTNQPAQNNHRDYATIDIQNEPIILRGDQKLVIENQHYLLGETITLKDNATLIIRNSLFEHTSSLGKKIALNAYGKSKVILENSILSSSCEKTVPWNFNDNASLAARNIETTTAGCFPHQKFLNSSSARIASWDGAIVTTCDTTNLALGNSRNLAIDLCLPTGAVVDETFPKQTTETYVFPNKNESKVASSISLSNTSIEAWNVRIVPKSDITIRNTSNISLSIRAQKPWDQETVSFDALKDGLFEDRSWKVVDAKLHLLNTSVNAWNFFLEHTNKLRLRDSTAHRITQTEDTIAILERSTADTIETSGFAEATFQESRINHAARSFNNSKITFIDSTIGSIDTDSILTATDKSVITLVHTASSARMIEELQGRIVVQ